MISPILSHNTENESSAITVNQNILNYILFIQYKDDEFFRETILSLNLSVLTCVPQFHMISFYYNTLSFILDWSWALHLIFFLIIL